MTKQLNTPTAMAPFSPEMIDLMLKLANNERERIRAEFEKWEEEARQIEALIKYLTCLNRLSDLGSSADIAITKRFSGLSLPNAVKILLREEGKPMELKDIAQRLKAGGFHSGDNDWTSRPWRVVVKAIRVHKDFIQKRQGLYGLANLESNN